MLFSMNILILTQNFNCKLIKEYIDETKQLFYNINTIFYFIGDKMTISEQIKILCIRSNISVAELSRRLGKSPQSFNAKLKRESFTIQELENIAKAVDAKFSRTFELSSGDII